MTYAVKGLYMNIYVGNISYQTKEEDLVELFSTVGSVDSARIIRYRETDAQKVLPLLRCPTTTKLRQLSKKFNGTEFLSRNITVNEAKPKGKTRRTRLEAAALALETERY